MASSSANTTAALVRISFSVIAISSLLTIKLLNIAGYKSLGFIAPKGPFTLTEASDENVAAQAIKVGACVPNAVRSTLNDYPSSDILVTNELGVCGCLCDC
jgi:hypothetical protein